MFAFKLKGAARQTVMLSTVAAAAAAAAPSFRSYVAVIEDRWHQTGRIRLLWIPSAFPQRQKFKELSSINRVSLTSSDL